MEANGDHENESDVASKEELTSNELHKEVKLDLILPELNSGEITPDSDDSFDLNEMDLGERDELSWRPGESHKLTHGGPTPDNWEIAQTEFSWNYDGTNVMLSGSFDQWEKKRALAKR